MKTNSKHINLNFLAFLWSEVENSGGISAMPLKTSSLKRQTNHMNLLPTLGLISICYLGQEAIAPKIVQACILQYSTSTIPATTPATTIPASAAPTNFTNLIRKNNPASGGNQPSVNNSDRQNSSDVGKQPPTNHGGSYNSENAGIWLRGNKTTNGGGQ